MGAPAAAEGNVRVVARIRPLAKYELENGSKQIVNSLPSLSSTVGGPIQIPTEPEVLEVKPAGAEKRWFELDAVLDGKSTQEEAYIKSGAQLAVTQDLFKGFNCTILAYGQTGAGKTFTMGSAAGTSMEIGEFDGIIPRACVDLFKQIQTRCDGNAQVELSYLEIYNEEMRDLLTDDGGAKGKGKVPEMKIRENLNGEVYVSGLSARPVDSPKAIGDFMEEASKRRVVASTKMNAVSSRSHAICVLRIKGVLEDDTKFSAKLTLVDLAGSERIKKTGAEGGRRKEGININKGLFVLGQVVSALSETRPKYKRKPPYRDSKLTRLLQDSLGGNSRTIMVACVSPADFNLDETVTTLRYATNARNIKNTATRNVIKSLSPEEAAKLQRENQLLKKQVSELQETIRKMGASDMDTASTAATSVGSSIDSVSSDDEEMDAGGEMTLSKQKTRIQELENEVRKLKISSSSGSGKGAITESMAEDAITLPTLKKRVAELEEEVAAKKEIEAENMELQEEMNHLKSDASSARLAADRMSKILEQLKDLKGDEIEKKRMEFDHIKVEEAWVSFVYQVLETNRQHMSKLQNDFMVVAQAVDSPDFMITSPNGGFMSRIRNRIGGNRRDGAAAVRSPGGNGSTHGMNSSRHERSVKVSNGSVRSERGVPRSNSERGVPRSNSSRRQRSVEGADQSTRSQRTAVGNSSRRTRTVGADEDGKQQDPQEDPTNIMKVIVNLKDELKAAHEVIRQQRVQVESAMKDKNSEETKTGDSDSDPVAADAETVSAEEFRKLKEKYTQLEIDRCWAEFQLRDRITNDALKFHRRIRAVMQKSKLQGSAAHEDPEIREMEIKTRVDGEIRQRLKVVMEHLKLFEGRMVQMQSHVDSEMNSLGEIRSSLRVQQDQMELEIGTVEIERAMMEKTDNDLLDQLTTLLVGPVKNLGSFPSEELQAEDTGAVPEVTGAVI